MQITQFLQELYQLQAWSSSQKIKFKILLTDKYVGLILLFDCLIRKNRTSTSSMNYTILLVSHFIHNSLHNCVLNIFYITFKVCKLQLQILLRGGIFLRNEHFKKHSYLGEVPGTFFYVGVTKDITSNGRTLSNVVCRTGIKT